MSFLTLSFVLFGCVLFAAFWGLPRAARPLVLGCANLWFAALLGAEALLALLSLTLLGWAVGLLLQRGGKKAALALGVCLLVLPLATYKYGGFLSEALGLGHLFTDLVAPVGVSFYVFKSIAYLVEVYRGSLPAEANLLHYFNYTGFFAQLGSGPIQRPGSLLPQLKDTRRAFNRQLALTGCMRLCWGLFLKKCLADPFAGYQKALYSPEQYYGLGVLWSLLGYSLQLYFDFASYSQLAIGVANLLGIHTEENFISPYFSRSIGEFWRRWHISLSSFLKDYIYIPLGGSRRGTARLILATMATFIASGAWHGATSGFLVWGALQGLYLLCGRATRPLREKAWALIKQGPSSPVRSLVSWAFTFALVVAAWFFFFAGNLQNAGHIASYLFQPFPLSLQYVKESIIQLGYTPAILLRMGLFTALAALVHWRSREKGFGAWVSGQKPWVQTLLCYACVFLALFYGAAGALPNIYFAF